MDNEDEDFKTGYSAPYSFLTSNILINRKSILAKENNMEKSIWIQTAPDRGWFTILRLYNPQQAWFDKTWRPVEIERLN
jgi:hypothetical protein